MCARWINTQHSLHIATAQRQQCQTQLHQARRAEWLLAVMQRRHAFASDHYRSPGVACLAPSSHVSCSASPFPVPTHIPSLHFTLWPLIAAPACPIRSPLLSAVCPHALFSVITPQRHSSDDPPSVWQTLWRKGLWHGWRCLCACKTSCRRIHPAPTHSRACSGRLRSCCGMTGSWLPAEACVVEQQGD